MDPSAGDEQRLKYSGLVIAAVGFLLSRVTLLVVVDAGGALSVFLTRGLVPLALGLALTAFGISLAVSTFEPWYVNTVATWTLLGTLGIVLVTGVSLLDPVLSGDPMMGAVTSTPLIANTLVGGAVGGTLIGVQSARNRRQRRALARQSNQVVVLDRILRDEVLNAVTSILARVDLLRDRTGSDGEHLDAIDRGAARIRDAVDDVGFLVQSDPDGPSHRPVPLATSIEGARADINRQFPEAAVDVDVPEVTVRADDRLATVFTNLLETAIDRHPDRAPSIEVTARVDGTAVSVSVADDGAPLTEKQRAILVEGSVSDHDDPAIGFGYPVVAFLVDRYDGELSVASTPEGTRVTVALPRVAEGSSRSKRHGVEPATLRAAAAAAVIAGLAMGAVLQLFADTIPVIGSLYGVPSVAVGWVTHLFHSVVFGILFVSVLDRPALERRIDSLGATVGAAVAFAALLAVVAAGIVMPLWLTAVGVPAPIPRFFPAGIAGHLVWGLVFGVCYRLLC